MSDELTAAQARVLGALIEKERTTPDAYPRTLKALTTACNQTTNRDPVVSYEPTQVETTVLALKVKGWARIVHPASGERATKYRHVIDDIHRVDAAEQSLLCVLLLRGAQTVNELKTRTERMHPFASPDEVEATLDALARRDPPLVARVDRAPGQREGRWIQLLETGAEQRAAAPPSPASVTSGAKDPDRIDQLEARVADLEARLDALIADLG
jgi:uncharacterized protein YceH (UPF0502 family)